jgi:hypothetical protein
MCSSSHWWHCARYGIVHLLRRNRSTNRTETTSAETNVLFRLSMSVVRFGKLWFTKCISNNNATLKWSNKGQ